MRDIKVGVVSTYKKMSKTVKKIASEYNLQVRIKEGILEKGVGYAQELELEGHDILIGRGPTGQMIKKACSVPVVIIEITAYDILKALYKAKNMGGKIAYIGHKKQDFSPEFKTITRIIGVEVECYPYSNIWEMDEQVQKILTSDNDVVVSTGLCVFEMARKSNINAVLVESSYETILSSICRAVELIKAIRKDQLRSKRFETVLELVNDGIIISDDNNKVSFVNNAAKELLNIENHKIIGKPLNKIKSELDFSTLFNNDKNKFGAIKKIGSKNFIINKKLININNQNKEQVFTFQEAEQIQLLEEHLRKELFKKGLVAKHTFDDIISNSRIMSETINRAKKYSQTNSTVLLIGESGTGKELFAQAIHNAGSRSSGPFVAVNCAALPENLLESELFGYEEGAFTGAKKGGKKGLFELAHGGTIFLDEIGEVPPSVQAHLLRVIQEREIMKLGGDRVIPVDVRIIAATNEDLNASVNKGKFRKDLYYRLEVLNLKIPPLRTRKSDIDLLAKKFLNDFSSPKGKQVSSFTKNVLEKLKQYDWPGNVRELQNFIEKYVVLCHENNFKDFNLLNRLMDEKINDKFSSTKTKAVVDSNNITVRIGTLEEMEREILEKLLSTGKSVKELSNILGTSRTTIWRRLKNHSLN